jgi:ribosomal protein S18 acetylase RimI-like enzyme
VTAEPPLIVVREAAREDADVIVDFNRRMAEETEGKTLDPSVISAGVRMGLSRPHLCRYFVAEIEGEPVGTCMITYELTDWRNGLLWWFQSVYVLPAHRGQGVFRSLYRHVETLAQADPEARGLRLYVMDDNHAARDTYRAVGMSESRYRVYERDWSEAADL